MLLLSLLSFLVPLLIGLAFTCSLWPSQRQARSHFFIKFFLATGLGLGISSCFFFIGLSVFGSHRKVVFVTEIALLVVSALILLYLTFKTKARDHSTGSSEFPPQPILKSNIRWILLTCFSIALISAIATFVFLSLSNPHGGWDAWAVWNMHAKSMFRGGNHWTDVFSELIDWSNPDYPLLIPGAVARGWYYVGGETVSVPMLIAMLFTFSTVGLMVPLLSTLRGESQGVLAGVILLGTPSFISYGALQLADIPLGFFFLATIALLVLQERLSTGNYSLLILAGTASGLAAWTKNEGVLFVVSIVIAHFVVAVLSRGWKKCLRQLAYFSLGLVPILIIVVYFKTQIAPPSTQLAPGGNFFSSEGLQIMAATLSDFSRYLQVLKAFVMMGVGGYFGGWPFTITIPLILIFYILILGTDVGERDNLNVAISLIAMCVMFTGYFWMYVVTPHDLLWLLESSLNRLFLQLWPSFIFTCFLIARIPEEALAKKGEIAL